MIPMPDLQAGGHWVTIKSGGKARHVYIGSALETKLARPMLVGNNGESYGQSYNITDHFEINTSLPRDQVELNYASTLPNDIFYETKPDKRPSNVTNEYVLVEVLQQQLDSETGETILISRGFIYLKAEFVNLLHGQKTNLGTRL